MSRLILIIVISFYWSFANGQDVLFDDHQTGQGLIFLEEINGEQTLVDILGNQVPMLDVFRLSNDEVVSKGWRSSISSDHGSGFRDAGPIFNLTYLDLVNETGVGFDDPNLGEARRNALEAAFAYYASVIEDNGVADIEIRESFSGNPISNPFGHSAAYYFGSKGFNKPFTQVHITTGNDPYGPYPDGYMQFNFHPNFNYNYNVNADPGSQQFDFYTIALHEIMHLLGFTSYADANGNSAASSDVYTSFDKHLADFHKTHLFEVNGSGPNITVDKPNDGALTSNQVWFELYPGQHAPVFSPDPFNSSSLDHFDNGRSDHGEYLMHPSLTNGEAFKLLHEDEVRVLEKLGYSVNYSVATSISDGFGVDAPIAITSGLYPNPAYVSTAVSIDIGQLDTREILVIVYDMTGRQSYSKVVLNRGPGPITAIDPYHNLPPGMYVVIGSSNDELFNEKLVIK